MRTLLCLALGCLLSAQAPLLKTLAPPNGTPARLQQLDISCTVAGGVAETTWEATVANDGPRPMEAEWILPLAGDQQVVAMALEMNGEWREATLTDRAVARRAYDHITRLVRDPAILEKEEGAQVRLRVAPIFARGASRVRITTRQFLRPRGDLPGLHLELPLRISPAPEAGRFAFRVVGPQRPVSPDLGLRASREGWEGSLDLAGHTLDTRLAFHWSPLEQGENETWQHLLGVDRFLLARMSLPSLPPLPAPKRILLAWDTSLSAKDRDLARILALLEDRLADCPEATVEVRALGVVELERRAFPPAADRLEAIRKLLKSWKAWGGFAWGSLEAKGFDEVLLATEGNALDDPERLAKPVARLFALAAHSEARYRTLHEVLSNRGGEVLDLDVLGRGEARSLLAQPRWRLERTESADGIRQIHPAQGQAKGECWLSARVDRLPARMTAHFRAPGGVKVVRTLAWAPETPTNSTASARWAEAELARLETEHPDDRSRLRAMALHFGLLTKDTALISLEKVEDYAQFAIEPPAAWRARWLRMVGHVPPGDTGWDAPLPTAEEPVEGSQTFEPDEELRKAWEARVWWRQGRRPPRVRNPHPEDFCIPKVPSGFPGATDGVIEQRTWELGVPGGVVGGVPGGVIGSVVGGSGVPHTPGHGELLEGQPSSEPRIQPLPWPTPIRVPVLSPGEEKGTRVERRPSLADLANVQHLREGDLTSAIDFAAMLERHGQKAFAIQALSETFAGGNQFLDGGFQFRSVGALASRMGMVQQVLSCLGHLEPRGAVDVLDWADFLAEGGRNERAKEILEGFLRPSQEDGNDSYPPPPPPPPPLGPGFYANTMTDSTLLFRLLALETRMALGPANTTVKPLAPWPLRVEVSWDGAPDLPIGLREPGGFLVWSGDPLSPSSTGVAARLPGSRMVFMAPKAQTGDWRVEACAPWRPLEEDVWIRIVVGRNFGASKLLREIHWVNLKGRSGQSTLLRFKDGS